MKRFVITFMISTSVSIAASLSIDEAVQMALVSYPDAQIASLNHQRAQAESRVQRADLYPKVILNGEYYPTKTFVMPVNGQFSTKQNDAIHADMTASYSILDFGRTQNRIAAAGYALDQAHSLKQLTQSELIEQVWFRYYGVAYAASLIDAAQSSVTFYESAYQQAQHMRLSGLKTEADELRFKASLMEAGERLAQAQSEYDKASLSLGVLIGENGLARVEKNVLDRKLDDLSAHKESLESLRQKLSENNPRLKTLHTAIAQNQALSKAAENERYGEIQLRAGAGYDNTLSSYDTYQAGIVGSIPLYDGGKLSAEAQKSRIAHSLAQQEFDKAERELWEDLYRTYRDLIHSEETIRTKIGVIEATTKTLALIHERYRQGLATQTDVLESQSTLETARFALIGAKYQKIQFYAHMQKLLDQGCDNDVCLQ
ncbi:MAG: TolC family protein [Sulfuricurvum sp.]